MIEATSLIRIGDQFYIFFVWKFHTYASFNRGTSLLEAKFNSLKNKIENINEINVN